jgi:hypothetical protein
MTGYGFGKKPSSKVDENAPNEDRLDLSGIARKPLSVDPALEEAAIRRGNALGFVDRGEGAASDEAMEDLPRRRRRATQPQSSVFIKGPKDTLDWFVEYTNQQGHRSYWQALEEFRRLVEGGS